MTLETKIIALAQAIGTDIKAVTGKQGDLTSLSTTAKNNLVAAINELFSLIGSAGAAIDDAAGNGDTDVTWSADKIYDELAQRQAADATLTALASIATAANQIIYATGADTFATTALSAFARTLLDDVDDAAARSTLGAAPLASPTFTGTPNVPTAIAGTNTTQAASTAFVQTAVAGLVASSPAALDTLNELAAALGNDPNFSATIATALGNRVRYDAAQTLTTAQRLQACQNIGIGDPETDLAAAYAAAKV